ncbi:MAG: EamA family transporter [Ilumatobacteraceae bacterium]
MAAPHAKWLTIVAFGLVLATMNLTFYAGVERLPLGVAVTIELLGPLGLAVALSRRAVELVWAATALVGVVLLGEGDVALDRLGLLFAALAALGWAGYILASRATGAVTGTLDGLALAMAVACLAASPFGIGAGGRLLEPRVLALGSVVALLSALVPFSLDLISLRTVPPRVFGVLMSLSPAVATLSGFVLLDERLGPVQLLGIALVVLASAATALLPTGGRRVRT